IIQTGNPFMRFCTLARAAATVVLGAFLLLSLSAQESKPVAKPTVSASELGKSSPANSGKSTSSDSTKSDSGNAQKSGTSETTVTVAPAGEKTDTSGQQTKGDSNDASIRVTVNEVIVPVTVTDEKGRFVSDLDKKDFQVYE